MIGSGFHAGGCSLESLNESLVLLGEMRRGGGQSHGVLTMRRIYLDNNASTPIHPAGADAMKPFLGSLRQSIERALGRDDGVTAG